MKQTSNPNEIKDFIAGLKIIIRNSWPTQEEFAQGVTSKVNMSNILRGKGGTSYDMRKALADRAGMPIEDIIALGKGKPISPGITQFTVANGESLPSATDCEDKNDYTGKSASELLHASGEATEDLHAAVTAYTKSMGTLIRDTVVERDKLLTLLAREQSIMNAVPMAIKVVEPDLKVTYTNRAMMERFQATPGDACDDDTTCLCGENSCMAKEVFATGENLRRMALVDGTWYTMSAHPIRDNAWRVSKVIILITLAEPWFELMQEMGWTPPMTMGIPSKTEESNHVGMHTEE